MQSISEERKYNVIFFGLDESIGGTSRQKREREDLDRVVKIINDADSSLSASSIKDMFRLGKYAANSKKARPILVKFVRSADVTILFSRIKEIPLKPDLSLTQRKMESILLKERWALIQSGITRNHIKDT